MKKVKVISLALASVMALSLAACGGTKSSAPASSAQPASSKPAASGAKFTFQVGYSAGEDTAMGKEMKKFKAAVEKDTNGAIKIDIYPNATLGADRELVESTMSGNVSMSAMATSPIVPFIPELAVFDIPSVFTDSAAARKALAGSFGDKIKSYFDKKGLSLLILVPQGMREMTSNKAVNKFDDFKGIKIRTMENQYHMAYWKALGANPTPLAFSELYIGLQQGLVQAQENPFQALVASKLYEQQKYVIKTHHVMFFSTLYINKKQYESIPADLKKIFDKCVKDLDDGLFTSAETAEKEALEFVKGKGLQVMELSADDQKKMQEAAKPVYDMIRKAVGDELVDALMKGYADAAKK